MATSAPLELVQSLDGDDHGDVDLPFDIPAHLREPLLGVS